MTTSNHEYDYGPANLAAYIRNISHPLLGACNTDASKDANMAGLLKKYVVLERAGLKVRVFKPKQSFGHAAAVAEQH